MRQNIGAQKDANEAWAESLRSTGASPRIRKEREFPGTPPKPPRPGSAGGAPGRERRTPVRGSEGGTPVRGSAGGTPRSPEMEGRQGRSEGGADLSVRYG